MIIKIFLTFFCLALYAVFIAISAIKLFDAFDSKEAGLRQTLAVIAYFIAISVLFFATLLAINVLWGVM